MLLNRSVRRASTILAGLALAAGTIASTGPAALASPAKPTIAATLCKTNGEIVKSNGGVQLWYSPTCRTAWGVIINWSAGSVISVTNENTGATQEATVQVTNQRTATAAVNDAGTLSYACGTNPFTIHPFFVCTGAF